MKGPPPPWMFGRGREYRVSDAQAEQLVARLRRAYVVGMIATISLTLVFILAATGVMTDFGMQRVKPETFFVEHPIIAISALVMFVTLLVGQSVGSLYWAAGPVLAGVSWTTAPREPHSLASLNARVGRV